MLTFVRCAHCGKSGYFVLRLFYTVKRSHCGACGHRRESEWSFEFCGLECFRRWLAVTEATVRGIPCQDCLDLETGESTGHVAGLRQNGTCPGCAGRKTVGGPLEGKATSE